MAPRPRAAIALTSRSSPVPSSRRDLRTVLVLISCLGLATAAVAADKDARPIVPSINDVIPTLPTVTVTSPAPYLKAIAARVFRSAPRQ